MQSIRFLLPFLVLVHLAGCAASSQSARENTPAEFQRLLGTWAWATGDKYEFVVHIAGVRPNGAADVSFKIQRRASFTLMEDRLFQQGDHVWVTVTSATARMEDGMAKLHVVFAPSRKYERFRWQSCVFTAPISRDDFLLGDADVSGQTRRVIFVRQPL